MRTVPSDLSYRFHVLQHCRARFAKGKPGLIKILLTARLMAWAHLISELEGKVGQEHGHRGLVVDLGQVLANAVAGTHAEWDEALYLRRHLLSAWVLL